MYKSRASRSKVRIGIPKGQLAFTAQHFSTSCLESTQAAGSLTRMQFGTDPSGTKNLFEFRIETAWAVAGCLESGYSGRLATAPHRSRDLKLSRRGFRR